MEKSQVEGIESVDIPDTQRSLRSRCMEKSQVEGIESVFPENHQHPEILRCMEKSQVEGIEREEYVKTIPQESINGAWKNPK